MKFRGVILLLLFLSPCFMAEGQTTHQKAGQTIYRMPKEGNFMRYLVEDGDTVYIANIAPAVKYAAGNGKYWRKESRLLYNFGKTYPYALEARRLIKEVDATLGEGNYGKRKKERYINTIQKNLIAKYEPVLRKMTVSQGKLLIKLIGRETGLTPYEIIHDYKSGIAANTWQGIAKLFGGDLKKEYDPDGEDKATEYLVHKWEEGQYPALYMSVFGKAPKIPVIEQDDPAAPSGRKKKRR